MFVFWNLAFVILTYNEQDHKLQLWMAKFNVKILKCFVCDMRDIFNL